MRPIHKILRTILALTLALTSNLVPAFAVSNDTYSDANETVALQFDDVAPDAWYYDAVRTMTEYDIVHGYDDGLFHPDDYMTTGELLTIIWQLAPTDEPLMECDFSDHWAADVIYSLKNTNAYHMYTMADVDTADEYASRGEAVTALMGLLLNAQRVRYDDVGGRWYPKNGTPYEPKYGWVFNNGNGLGMYEVISDWDIVKLGRPADANDPETTDGKYWVNHGWLPERIMGAYVFDFVHGKDNTGAFDPTGNLTRAEFCQMLYNTGIAGSLMLNDGYVA